MSEKDLEARVDRLLSLDRYSNVKKENNKIEGFRREALAVEAAQEADGPDTGNEHAEAMNRIGGELRSAGRGRELLFLLDDPSAIVRLWAAAHTLDVDPTKSKRVLKALAREQGFAAFQAEFVLEKWEAGDLEFLS